jgi:hypothetical protein
MIGEKDCGFAAWMVWTVVKWFGISLAFLMAIVVGWLVVLVTLPGHAGEVSRAVTCQLAQQSVPLPARRREET